MQKWVRRSADAALSAGGVSVAVALSVGKQGALRRFAQILATERCQDVLEVCLFGSRAHGGGQEWSDVDLLVLRRDQAAAERVNQSAGRLRKSCGSDDFPRARLRRGYGGGLSSPRGNAQRSEPRPAKPRRFPLVGARGAVERGGNPHDRPGAGRAVSPASSAAGIVGRQIRHSPSTVSAGPASEPTMPPST